MSSGLTFFR